MKDDFNYSTLPDENLDEKQYMKMTAAIIFIFVAVTLAFYFTH